MLQTGFDIPALTGNPFDLSQNDVRVTFKAPNGITGTIPAFFDGGTTWRTRFTPTTPGIYSVIAVTLNGQEANPVNLNPTQFQVASSLAPGFIRLDSKNKMRFMFDDGSPYYPLGFNLAWRGDGQPPLTQSLDRMGHAGVNWTRIWMNHWDEKNLDWPKHGADPIQLGQLSLSTAWQWDQIIAAAENDGVYLQLVLQHHGQYSSASDPDWPKNPWNKANGGWLENSSQFFTDPQAIALTKNKYRYIIARWGYSPAIMAWELFNEIEWTDAFKTNLSYVAAWHQTMAAFIREQDPYHHLITTSSRTAEPSLWPAMDYYQAHVYTHDVTSAMEMLDEDRLDRAYFYGEYGGRAVENGGAEQDLHNGLWASLMSSASGAAQFWFWDFIQSKNLFSEFTAARNFIQRSGLLHESDMTPLEITAHTANRVALRFSPRSSWMPANATDFTIHPGGEVENISKMSSYLQGNSHSKSMFPDAVFHVDYPAAGTFAIALDRMTSAGAKLEVELDGVPAADLDLAPLAPGQPDPRLNVALEVPVSRGRHTIRLENTGPDWVHIARFILNPYTPQLGVVAKGNGDLTVMWVFNRDPKPGQPISGTLEIPGLPAGNYAVTWINTQTGEITKSASAAVSSGVALALTTPSIAQDAACWVKRVP